MKQIKVLEKGYRIECVSWENDADNYRTEYLTVDTLEEALSISKMMQELFTSEYRGGIGNTMGKWENSEKIIQEYIDNNNLKTDIDSVKDIVYDLMGSSEYYDYRVCESCKVYHIKEDVYAEVI